MKKVDSILKNKSYYNIYRSSYVCFVAQEIFNNLFKENNVSVLSLKGKNLNIKSANNFIATEINFQQDEIIEKINKKVKSTIITKIRIY